MSQFGTMTPIFVICKMVTHAWRDGGRKEGSNVGSFLWFLSPTIDYILHLGDLSVLFVSFVACVCIHAHVCA